MNSFSTPGRFRYLLSMTLLAILLVILLVTGYPAANAEEMLVRARVLRSEPILTDVTGLKGADSCQKPMEKNLLNLLHWDLGTGSCLAYSSKQRIEGYRIYYEWDNQEFSFVSARQPGTHIPLKVSFESVAPGWN